MAEFLSPGVFVEELDASAIAPTVSTSVGVFAGNFVKGPSGDFRLITSVAELIDVYGKPTNDNYNEWYQAYNFLQYGNKLYVARAVDALSLNGVAELPISGGVATTDVELDTDQPSIGSLLQWEEQESGLAASGVDAKLKFVARNQGSWINNVEIAVATSSSFGTGTEAFTGIELDGLFEYVPGTNELAIAIKSGDLVAETFIVSLSPGAKDINGKSAYVEEVINNNSQFVFVKDVNTADLTVEEALGANAVIFTNGTDAEIQADDLADAYGLFDNKEFIDIDIVIGNEIDAGVSAKNLVDARKDCIGFIGVEYADVVGKKASDAVANLVTWRKTGNGNINSMFLVACGNYKYQYDRYNDKNRWINIAGDVAGLRAATSTNRAAWWASAGLERGQIKNVRKLAFNPSQGQRDVLYKNAVNPICTFPGQGTVMWGQKTLLDKPSSFDRVNVRGLFNTLERSLSKMAKYQVMEFNDNFTRNRIVSMIKPFLSSVQAGRGIQDFLVVCDETNNTADVISRNQLVVDVFIKPTYVAEFIHLKFTNAGTNSFAEVVGGQ